MLDIKKIQYLNQVWIYEMTKSDLQLMKELDSHLWIKQGINLLLNPEQIIDGLLHLICWQLVFGANTGNHMVKLSAKVIHRNRHCMDARHHITGYGRIALLQDFLFKLQEFFPIRRILTCFRATRPLFFQQRLDDVFWLEASM